MTIQGTIYDNSTNAGIPGASVTVVSGSGVATGSGVAADNMGDFAITNTALDTGGKLVISSIGYKSVIVDPSVFNEMGFVGLDRDPEALQAVTVTAKKKTTANYLPYLAAGGLLLLVLPGDKKKKKSLSGVGVDWTKIALTGGIAVGGYFLVVKPILESLGILKVTSPQDKSTMDAQKSALDQAIQDAKNNNQPGQRYSNDQYTGWANDIFSLGTSMDTLDSATQQKIVNDVINVNTMVDLQLLISAFGIRQAGGSMCAWFNLYCKSYDLPTFLKTVLDTIHINYINGYLDDQNINYQF